MATPNEDLTSYVTLFTDMVTTNTNRTVTRSHAVNGTAISLRRSRQVNSVNTPGFFKLKKRAMLPVNPYQKSVYVYSDPGCLWFVHYDDNNGIYKNDVWQYTNCSNWLYGAPNLSTADDPTQRAISSLLQSLSDGKTNTLVTAAEMHKTVDMVTKTATRLYRAAKALKRGDFREFTNTLGMTFNGGRQRRFDKRFAEAKTTVKSKGSDPFGHRPKDSSDNRMSDFFAESWLEFSYGWKPLMKDVYDHARALAELTVERMNVVRYASGKARTRSARGPIKSDPSAQAHFISYNSSEHSRWVKFSVSYSLQNGELNTFSQLGIDNPLEVAWELLPFSFVADWFLPIGDFVRCLSATTGLRFNHGSKSTREVINTKVEVLSDGKGWITTDGRCSAYSGGPMVRTQDSLFITRSSLLDFPSPVIPEFKRPFGTGEDYGLRKALSAISLLQSLFLKKSSNPEFLRL